jgi:hypothetical protein
MNIQTVFAAIAAFAAHELHWQAFDAKGHGPATVTGHAVNLPRRPETRRVWGPRCNPA